MTRTPLLKPSHLGERPIAPSVGKHTFVVDYGERLLRASANHIADNGIEYPLQLKLLVWKEGKHMGQEIA